MVEIINHSIGSVFGIQKDGAGRVNTFSQNMYPWSNVCFLKILFDLVTFQEINYFIFFPSLLIKLHSCSIHYCYIQYFFILFQQSRPVPFICLGHFQVFKEPIFI